jgi:hypothetical protein
MLAVVVGVIPTDLVGVCFVGADGVGERYILNISRMPLEIKPFL